MLFRYCRLFIIYISREVLNNNDLFKNVVYTLGQLAIEFPEVTDYLNARLKEADLRLPQRPPAQSRGMVSDSTHSLPKARPDSGKSTGSSAGNVLKQRTFDVEF